MPLPITFQTLTDLGTAFSLHEETKITGGGDLLTTSGEAETQTQISPHFMPSAYPVCRQF